MTRLRIACLAAAVLAACAGGASAQPIPQAGCVNASPCVQTNVFTPIGATTLSAGTSTSNVALPSVASNLSVVVTNNSASIIAYVNAGTSNSVTATTSNTPIQPGQTVVLLAGANTYLAGITANSTASLTIQVGTGVPVITNAAASSGGGSGGSVTQGTSPWVDNITQWASGVLAAMANYGTAPSGLVPGVNAFVTNAPDIPNAAAPTVSASQSVTSLVLKASATTTTGGVKYFHAENATSTGGYCILYNGTTAPSTGALTAGNVLAFQLLPANSYCDLNRISLPIAASTGAVVLVSSANNPFTYTTGAITASISGLAQ